MERRTIAILTAAGVGRRMNQDIPKQFMYIDDKPLIAYTLEAFQKHPSVDEIIVVCLKGWEEQLRDYAKQYGITKLSYIVPGGETGQESIRCGIMEASKHYDEDSICIIHDGNRGLVSQDIISDALRIYETKGNAVAAMPCIEAIFRSNDGEKSNIEISRDELFRTQTPHVWSLKKMIWAHEQAAKRGIVNTTATCTLMQKLGETVYFSKGSDKNLKITVPEDVEIFKALLKDK